MSTRPRSSTTQEALASELLALAHEYGPSFCSYSDESSSCSKATLRKAGDGNILEACNVRTMQTLHRCGKGNLVVSRKTMEGALRIVASQCQKDWRFTPSEADDFVTTLGRKIRNLARATAQGVVISPSAAWLKAMSLPETYEEDEGDGNAQGDIDGDALVEAAGGDETGYPSDAHIGGESPATPTCNRNKVPIGLKKKPAPGESYAVSWSQELMLPIRRLDNHGALGHSEPGLPVSTSAPRGSDDELVIAEWHDGYTARIPGFAWSQLDLLTRGDGADITCDRIRDGARAHETQAIGGSKSRPKIGHGIGRTDSAYSSSKP